MSLNLHNIDCMELMAQYPDKHFDLALVDPPYGINAPNMSATPNQRRSGLQRLNGSVGKLKNRVLNTAKKITWDDAIPTYEYFDELNRVSKNKIIWGGNYFPLPPTRCVICWDKVQPWENFSQIEIAWTSFDSPARIFKFDNRTGDKLHPTQKPIDLYKWLLKNYAKEGDKILDTHGGSMSSVIACIDMGFSITCCELDKDYFEESVKRVQNFASQLDAFRKQPEIIIHR